MGKGEEPASVYCFTEVIKSPKVGRQARSRSGSGNDLVPAVSVEVASGHSHPAEIGRASRSARE